MPRFELPNNTECRLTTFVGRTQKSGPHDVPAVSFRLLLESVPNTTLDMLSKDIRLTAYAPVEGQDQLPGVEPATPILRSKDLKHWAPETTLEGWRVIVARGIDDSSALQMGTCKIDDFKADFHDGGHIDLDFRVGTADIDEDGAGMLWARQKQKVFVTIIAPEAPAPAIDGTTEAFKRDHPDAGGQDQGPDLFAEGQADRATEAFLGIHGSETDAGAGGPPDSDTDAGAGGDDDSKGGTTDAEQRGRTELPRTVKYRHPSTGETWSGRGNQPAWIRRALAAGRSLDEFAVEPVQA